MDSRDHFSWTYLGNDQPEACQASKDTVVVDDVDFVIPGTQTTVPDRQFILDNVENGKVHGHIFMDEGGTQKRIDITRTCGHVKPLGNFYMYCAC